MPRSRDKVSPRAYATYGRTHAARLPDYDYAGPDDLHVVICASHDAPFSNRALATTICAAVEQACQLRRYRLYGYCLMPDHLHVLLSPAASGTPIKAWLHSLKGFTTSWYMKNGGRPPLWQRSAYDHVCRAGEAAESVLAYIINNPVRAGLVLRWREWPWTRVFIEL